MSDTRERIEIAAVAEFANHGFHGARVHRIAGQAGVNKQLLYYYFGSKRQLYEHSIRSVADGILPAAGGGPSPVGTPGERIRHLLRLAADHLSAHPNHVRTILLGALEARLRGGAPAPRVARDLVRGVAAEVSRGQGLGHFRDDADPEDCGRQAAVLLLGWVALNQALTGETGPRSAAPSWVDSVIALLNRSLTW
ncbi:MAG: TetR/AcrR family transcriptional regulator [Gemmatimonadota bacterium]|nr:TetR/AcrR family transcriptional regulator [Gemmatimonadota bacterium]MDH3367207.1 TetR/AcrR family transcriptional regulator [Gemmatimonadota bacterium]MDH3476905.1 TetR/AcrR family transcriptional regulator [Gemmatimonadota bacterium]MDH3568588.1 TetR/AcrR family transcriptional regulator [Gemmatimonadota bacterium]MDH5548291.1 TetR/AcrR family transcriptional regulator [Gemmatimonadota bacterium]